MVVVGFAYEIIVFSKNVESKCVSKEYKTSILRNTWNYRIITETEIY